MSKAEKTRKKFYESIEKPKVPYIKVDFKDKDGKEKTVDLHIIPDPPHLIKNLRTHFRSKDNVFYLDGKIQKAKFSHVRQLFELDKDPARGVNVCPKLKKGPF